MGVTATMWLYPTKSKWNASLFIRFSLTDLKTAPGHPKMTHHEVKCGKGDTVVERDICLTNWKKKGQSDLKTNYNSEGTIDKRGKRARRRVKCD